MSRPMIIGASVGLVAAAIVAFVLADMPAGVRAPPFVYVGLALIFLGNTVAFRIAVRHMMRPPLPVRVTLWLIAFGVGCYLTFGPQQHPQVIAGMLTSVTGLLILLS